MRYDMKGAVSLPFDRSRNIRVYYDRAAELLSRGTPGKRLVRFSEELPSVILAGCRMGEHAESLCIPDILKLKPYDNTHKTDLAKTLRVFLESGLCVNLTAKSGYPQKQRQARLAKITP
jgi:DNA-binding PucR family transcriptional regulator